MSKMYIRKTTRSYKSKTYTNHLLVESVQTPQGPRQRTIVYEGPFDQCDREADYHTVWAEFARRQA